MPPWPRRPLRRLGIREPTDGQTRTTGPSYLKARRRPTTTRNFEWSSLPPSFLGDIISEDPILAEHFGLFNFARGELPRKQRRRGGRKIRATAAAAAHYHVGRSFSKTAAEVAIKNVSWPPARARPPANNNLSEEGGSERARHRRPSVVAPFLTLTHQEEEEEAAEEEGEQRRRPRSPRSLTLSPRARRPRSARPPARAFVRSQETAKEECSAVAASPPRAWRAERANDQARIN